MPHQDHRKITASQLRNLIDLPPVNYDQFIRANVSSRHHNITSLINAIDYAVSVMIERLNKYSDLWSSDDRLLATAREAWRTKDDIEAFLRSEDPGLGFRGGPLPRQHRFGGLFDWDRAAERLILDAVGARLRIDRVGAEARYRDHVRRRADEEARHIEERIRRERDDRRKERVRYEEKIRREQEIRRDEMIRRDEKIRREEQAREREEERLRDEARRIAQHNAGRLGWFREGNAGIHPAAAWQAPWFAQLQARQIDDVRQRRMLQRMWMPGAGQGMVPMMRQFQGFGL